MRKPEETELLIKKFKKIESYPKTHLQIAIDIANSELQSSNASFLPSQINLLNMESSLQQLGYLISIAEIAHSSDDIKLKLLKIIQQKIPNKECEFFYHGTSSIFHNQEISLHGLDSLQGPEINQGVMERSTGFCYSLIYGTAYDFATQTCRRLTNDIKQQALLENGGVNIAIVYRGRINSKTAHSKGSAIGFSQPEPSVNLEFTIDGCHWYPADKFVLTHDGEGAAIMPSDALISQHRQKGVGRILDTEFLSENKLKLSRYISKANINALCEIDPKFKILASDYRLVRWQQADTQNTEMLLESNYFGDGAPPAVRITLDQNQLTRLALHADTLPQVTLVGSESGASNLALNNSTLFSGKTSAKPTTLDSSTNDTNSPKEETDFQLK